MVALFSLLGQLSKTKVSTSLAIVFQLLTAAFTLVSIPFVIPFFQILFATSPASVQPPQSSWDLEGTLNYGFSRLIAMTDRPIALLTVCLIIIILFLMRNCFRFLSSYFLVPAVNAVIRDLRQSIFDSFLNMSIQQRSRLKKGHLLSLLSNDLNEVDHGIIKAIDLTVKSPLIIIGCLVFMIWINAKLALLAVVLLLVIGIVIGSLNHSLKRQSLKAQNKLAALLSAADEYLHSMRVVDSYNAKDYFKNRFQQENKEHFRLNNVMFRRRDLASPLTEFLAIVVVVVLLWMGSQMVFSGSMQPATFFAFIFAFYHSIEPAKRFSREMANVSKGVAALERIRQFKLESDGSDIICGVIKAVSLGNKLEFRGVTFMHDQGAQPVLDDLSFSLERGEKLGITGLSGAGKSTIIDLILRFYQPESGEILLDDRSITQYDLKEYRQLFGLVSQQPVLFHASIKDNIILNRFLNSESLDDAVKASRVDEIINKKPAGIESIVGDLGIRLSGGEKQRISIARALYGKPSVLILDEPTSSLDAKTEEEIIKAIRGIIKDQTTILISHQMELLRHMDRIVVIHEGRIVQNGSFDNLVTVRGIFKNLFDRQLADPGGQIPSSTKANHR